MLAVALALLTLVVVEVDVTEMVMVVLVDQVLSLLGILMPLKTFLLPLG